MKKLIGFSVAILALACSATWAGDVNTVALSQMSDTGLMFGFAGLIVNKDSINTIFTGLKTIFNNG